MTASLDTMVDQTVTIEGVARNAAGGAIVMLEDRTPVYLDGLDRWDRTTDGKQVTVKGTLRKHGGQKTVNEKGEYIHGFPDARFVVEKPSWTPS